MFTTSQQNRFVAYDNLQKALNLDATPFQNDAAMLDFNQRLGILIAAMRAAQKPGLRIKKGLTLDKQAARLHLNTVAAEMAGDLFAYATKLQNATLQAEADYSEGDLRNLSGVRVTITVDNLINRIKEHQAALATYAVDAARIKELEDALTAYDGRRSSPRQQVTENSAARMTTGQLFRAAASLVRDELQRSLRKYARSAPAFYARVISAREVIDLTATHGGSDNTPPAPQP